MHISSLREGSAGSVAGRDAWGRRRSGWVSPPFSGDSSPVCVLVEEVSTFSTSSPSARARGAVPVVTARSCAVSATPPAVVRLGALVLVLSPAVVRSGALVLSSVAAMPTSRMSALRNRRGLVGRRRACAASHVGNSSLPCRSISTTISSVFGVPMVSWWAASVLHVLSCAFGAPSRLMFTRVHCCTSRVAKRSLDCSCGVVLAAFEPC